MLIVWSEISHLKEIMGETSEYRTARNIAGTFPALRCVTNFKFNMLLNIFESELFEPLNNCDTCLFPDLIPVLFLLPVNMACTNYKGESVLTFRSCRCVG